MLIAQLSDVHVGGARYREELLHTAIAEINAAEPDLVVIAGDLTDDGYPDQYPLAASELAALAAPQIVRVPGNHDARNVGYVLYEDTFGPRDSRLRFESGGLDVALIGVDSSKPDIDEGEIGREHYGWIEEDLQRHRPPRLGVPPPPGAGPGNRPRTEPGTRRRRPARAVARVQRRPRPVAPSPRSVRLAAHRDFAHSLRHR